MQSRPSCDAKRFLRLLLEIIATRRSGLVTLDEVAAKIGGSKGTIYYYFKSKGEMLYHLNMYFFELIQDAVLPILDNEAILPRDRLEQLIHAETKVICDNWQLARSLWWDIALRETPVGLARVISRVRGDYNRAVTKLVEEVAETENLISVDAKVVSLLILGTMAGISRWYRKGGKLSAEQVADYTVWSTFNSVLAEPEGQHVAGVSQGRQR